MKDLTGKLVSIGDIVAFTVPRYSYLVIGCVKKVTAGGVTVDYTDHYGLQRTTNRQSNQFILHVSKEAKDSQEVETDV